MISLQHVSKTYTIEGGRPVAALHDVSLDVERGEFLVITGRSGSGKTTLLNVASGLARPTSGTVLLDGVELSGLSDHDQATVRNRKIGFVFQFPSLMPSLSALANVTLPRAFGSVNGNDPVERGTELLDMVGLADRLGSFPRQLSAGQQQRVVIARALINQPELLLADEPSSDLDEETEDEIMALFSRVHAETGVTILMVTHTKQLVSHGTRHVEMAGGELRPG